MALLIRLTSLSCGFGSPHKQSITSITGSFVNSSNPYREQAAVVVVVPTMERWQDARYDEGVRAIQRGRSNSQIQSTRNMLAKWAACRETHEISVNTVTSHCHPPLHVHARLLDEYRALGGWWRRQQPSTGEPGWMLVVVVMVEWRCRWTAW